ncbi:hypothetical protein EW146_g682 [Bondarzewia mesenterica]|uniref:DUF155 domain-containing protein n=1 Tax=Bondarzewia mesenterica TaxID=1095465 RepID=A0A4S4M8E4_9AGAM|nr:hypothetical protein EW146_g682 [Bondarzewia mesenterica]
MGAKSAEFTHHSTRPCRPILVDDLLTPGSTPLLVKSGLRVLAFSPFRARRGFATTSGSDLSDDGLTKAKPKAFTPLRRTASDSLPIRANPKPTRSEIQLISTLATAERYILPRLRSRLPPTSRPIHESYWVPKWGAEGKEGEVFIFGNGSFVCWGLSEEDAKRFQKEVLARSEAEFVPLKEAETEELEFVMDPSENTRLQGDLIILGSSPVLSEAESLPSPLPPSAFPQETLLARYAFSQALSRSTALSVLEVSLENYLSSVSSLPLSLQRTGKPGLGRRALIKKLGELLKFRQGLNLNRENFYDTPDFYWAEPVLEGYFNSLSNALEVRVRTRSVNDKITYAAEVQSVLRQLLTETSAARMELVIIALIAVEVVIVLIRDAPELWGSPEESQSKRVESA